MMKFKKYITLLLVGLLLFSCSKNDITPTPPTPDPTPDPSGPTVPTNIPNTQNPQTKGTTYWWNKAVFYEIFTRSFYDSNGDGIGDLNGITQKLDYIQNDLGATAIWLMPINSSPSYHGYDVTDYKNINPDYGTMQDFKNLVQEVHNRGMKIIIDLVINHTSNDNPWFQNAWNDKNSKYRNWYIFKDNDPNYNSPWGSDVWHGNKEHGYYYGIFSFTMPDLNYNNPEVKNEIKSISNFWLTNVNIDGFRLDAAKHIIEEGQKQENTTSTINYWKEFSQNVKTTKPEAITVGEVWTSTSEIIKYINGGLDLAFEFDVADAIKNAIKANNPSNLKNKLTSIRDIYPYHKYATFLSNHDQDRSFEVMGKNLNNAKLAASILLTLPGTPFIYYAEEIGVWGRKSGGDEWVRKPMNWTSSGGFTTGTPWTKLSGDQNTQNVTTQKANSSSLLNSYKKFISLRKKYPQFTEGTFQNLGNSSNALYSYLRESEEKGIVVIHNFGTSSNGNTTVYAKKTNLKAGIYTVTDLLENKKLENIALNSDGGFSFKPLSSIKGKGTKLLLLQKK